MANRHRQPKLLESLLGLGVRQVSCGGQHAAVLTDDGVLFTWGRASFGRLGHGPPPGAAGGGAAAQAAAALAGANRLVPTRVEALADVHVVQAGRTSSSVRLRTLPQTSNARAHFEMFAF